MLCCRERLWHISHACFARHPSAPTQAGSETVPDSMYQSAPANDTLHRFYHMASSPGFRQPQLGARPNMATPRHRMVLGHTRETSQVYEATKTHSYKHGASQWSSLMCEFGGICSPTLVYLNDPELFRSLSHALPLADTKADVTLFADPHKMAWGLNVRRLCTFTAHQNLSNTCTHANLDGCSDCLYCEPVGKNFSCIVVFSYVAKDGLYCECIQVFFVSFMQIDRAN